MGLFDKIKEAQSSQGGIYLTPGNYQKIKVEAVKTGRTRKNKDFFVAELRIIESTGEHARKPGSKCSWMVMLDQDAALGNVKGFTASLFGVDEAEVDSESVEDLVGKEQPGAGRFISAEAFEVDTKKGTKFTKVVWSAIPEESQEVHL